MNAISPLDSRYKDRVSTIGFFFSDRALLQSKVQTEIDWVEYLMEDVLGKKISQADHDGLMSVFGSNSLVDDIIRIEHTTRHDVKAIEVYLRSLVSPELANFIHFGLTSEDVNNLAYARRTQEYIEHIQLDLLKRVINSIVEKAKENKHFVMPTRTHGQLATPSTVGKELMIYANRLAHLYANLKDVKIKAKLNGTVGNYSTFYAAYPDIDWPEISKVFIQRLGLEPETITKQISNRDSLIRYFDLTRQINNILLDFSRDMWLYISHGVFKQTFDSDSVGSSVMPHKVNPIHFENMEGNIEVSNALLMLFSNKLGVSRMSRDLSCSTVMRNIGVALAHSYLAMTDVFYALPAIMYDKTCCDFDMNFMKSEGVQTILRTIMVGEDPYTALKTLIRDCGQSKCVGYIEENTDEESKKKVETLYSSEYVGLANKVFDTALDEIENLIG